MIICLAGSGWTPLWIDNNIFNFNRLESFYYLSQKEIPFIHKYDNFYLDSGAFTYMNRKNKNINWQEYVIKYATFIRENNIKYFFELDIDNIVGIKEVERLRDLLEKISGKKCIPVWHKSRGLEYWNKICKDYDYIAIGGIVTNEIKSTEYDIFLPLLKIAKENNTKVHALGFTRLGLLSKYKFYSVDSTSWLSGNRFGKIAFFNGKNIVNKEKPIGTRAKTKKIALHNFLEWVKFLLYAKDNL
jgi:hypothetical protein